MKKANIYYAACREEDDWSESDPDRLYGYYVIADCMDEIWRALGEIRPHGRVAIIQFESSGTRDDVADLSDDLSGAPISNAHPA